MSNQSQRFAIGKHLKAGKSLTPLQALSLFSCWRLSGRILELRKGGMSIRTKMVKRGAKTFAEYRAA